MKRSVMIIAALTVLLALFVPLAPAQTQPAAQDPAKEEADAYKAWYDAYTAKDLTKEIELGKAFVQKFPSSKNADYVKKDIARARGILFNQALQQKNMDEMIRIGKEVLAEDPDNLDYLSAMAVHLSTNELFAKTPNYSHAADIVDFTNRALRLIEAGKTPTGDPSKFDKAKTQAFFHRALAAVEDKEGGNTDRAIQQYMEVAKLEPMNAANYFQCGRLHQLKYTAAAKKYEAIPQADRDAAPAEMKPDVKAALDELNREADAVINCWVRFLGLTATDMKGWESLRPKIQETVTTLYKYRNNDSTAGLDKLIEQNKGATPVSMPPPSAAPATASAPAGATTTSAKPMADQGGTAAKPNSSAPAKTTAAPAKPNGKKPRR